MKQKHTFFVTVGIPSLFLIFSVLCLCVLALLTLGSSRSSLNTARHSMKQTENYYTGCASATETVSEIRDDLEPVSYTHLSRLLCGEFLHGKTWFTHNVRKFTVCSSCPLDDLKGNPRNYRYHEKSSQQSHPVKRHRHKHKMQHNTYQHDQKQKACSTALMKPGTL